MLNQMRSIAWREWKNNYSKIVPVFFKLANPAITMLLFTMIFAGSSNSITYNGNQVRYLEYLIPGLMCVLTASMVHIGHQSIIGDKQSGIASIIITSGVSMRIYLFVRILSNSFFEILRLCVLLTTTILFLKLEYFLGFNNIILFFSSTLLLCFFWYGVGILIAIFIKIQIFKDVIFGIAMMIVPIASPAYFNITRAPHWLQIVSNYNPLTFACKIARHSLLDSNPEFFSVNLFVLFLLALISSSLMLIFSNKLSYLL